MPTGRPEARPRPHHVRPAVRHRGPASPGRRAYRRGLSELRALAGGRGDLLAETAGVMAGASTVRIGTGEYLLAAGLLVLAGAEHDLIARWVDVGRERVMTPRHSV
jgi:hypothetical protein